MQHKSRLTGNKRFSQIHQEGTSAANRFLVIRFLANGLDQSRFGILTSKRIGNAVVRNRVKRRLREAIRSSRIRSGWDALFIARRGSDKASYEELRQATVNLLQRSKLVDTSEGADLDGTSAGASR